jgi:hypothetical protein
VKPGVGAGIPALRPATGLRRVAVTHAARLERPTGAVVEASTTARGTPEPVRSIVAWITTVAATVVSTCALDAVATLSGAVLAASPVFDGMSHVVVVGFLAATYILWFAALRINLVANWHLLEQTGTSTNLPSKAMFELARCRSSSPHLPRVASAAAYLATEIAKEAPYYAGAFGTALLTDTVDSTDALVFLGGTNIGAAVYEYGLARLSCIFLDRRFGDGGPDPRPSQLAPAGGRRVQRRRR